MNHNFYSNERISKNFMGTGERETTIFVVLKKLAFLFCSFRI